MTTRPAGIDLSTATAALTSGRRCFYMGGRMKKPEKKSEKKVEKVEKSEPSEKVESVSSIMTIDDLAQFLKTSRRSIYNLTRRRNQSGVNPLPVLRLGIGMRFRRTDIDCWLTAAAR